MAVYVVTLTKTGNFTVYGWYRCMDTISDCLGSSCTVEMGANNKIHVEVDTEQDLPNDLEDLERSVTHLIDCGHIESVFHIEEKRPKRSIWK